MGREAKPNREFAERFGLYPVVRAFHKLPQGIDDLERSRSGLDKKLVDVGRKRDKEGVPDPQSDEEACVSRGPDENALLKLLKSRCVGVEGSGAKANKDTEVLSFRLNADSMPGRVAEPIAVLEDTEPFRPQGQDDSFGGVYLEVGNGAKLNKYIDEPGPGKLKAGKHRPDIIGKGPGSGRRERVTETVEQGFKADNKEYLGTLGLLNLTPFI